MVTKSASPSSNSESPLVMDHDTGPLAEAEALFSQGRLDEALDLVAPYQKRSMAARACVARIQRAQQQGLTPYCLQLLEAFAGDHPAEASSYLSSLKNLGTKVAESKNLKSAFDSLSPAEQNEIKGKAGNSFDEIISLSQEKNPEMFWEQILNFSEGLLSDGKTEAAAGVLNLIHESLGEGKGFFLTDISKRASAQLQAIQGQGSTGLRFEFLASHFLQDVMDYKSVLPMIVSGGVGELTQTLTLGRWANLGQKAWYQVGMGARISSGLLSFGVEVATFSLLGRGLRQLSGEDISWDAKSVGADFLESTLSLGALKLCGFLGNQGFLKLHGLSELGAPTRLSGLAKFTQVALPQVSTFAGMMASHKLEESLDLRKHVDNATTVTDTLVSMVNLGVGGHLGHTALGESYASFQKELGTRANIYSDFSKESGKLQAKAQESRSSKLRRSLSLAQSPLLAPMWMMLGAGGPGGGGIVLRSKQAGLLRTLAHRAFLRFVYAWLSYAGDSGGPNYQNWLADLDTAKSFYTIRSKRVDSGQGPDLRWARSQARLAKKRGVDLQVWMRRALKEASPEAVEGALELMFPDSTLSPYAAIERRKYWILDEGIPGGARFLKDLYELNESRHGFSQHEGPDSFVRFGGPLLQQMNIAESLVDLGEAETALPMIRRIARSKDSGRSVEANRILWKAGQKEEALANLTALLHDPVLNRISVARDAANLMLKIDGENKDALVYLLDQLKEKPASIARILVEHHAPEAVPHLLQAIKLLSTNSNLDPPLQSRKPALWKYLNLLDEYFRRSDQEGFIVLVKTLTDFDSSKTMLIDGETEYAWDHIREEFLKLFKTLKHGSFAWRGIGSALIKMLPPYQIVDELVAWSLGNLQNEQIALRSDAIRFAGEMGIKKSIPTLEASLRSNKEKADILLDTCTALVKLGRLDSVKPVLRRLLSDPKFGEKAAKLMDQIEPDWADPMAQGKKRLPARGYRQLPTEHFAEVLDENGKSYRLYYPGQEPERNTEEERGTHYEISLTGKNATQSEEKLFGIIKVKRSTGEEEVEFLFSPYQSKKDPIKLKMPVSEAIKKKLLVLGDDETLGINPDLPGVIAEELNPPLPKRKFKRSSVAGSQILITQLAQNEAFEGLVFPKGSIITVNENGGQKKVVNITLSGPVSFVGRHFEKGCLFEFDDKGRLKSVKIPRLDSSSKSGPRDLIISRKSKRSRITVEFGTSEEETRLLFDREKKVFYEESDSLPNPTPNPGSKPKAVEKSSDDAEQEKKALDEIAEDEAQENLEKKVRRIDKDKDKLFSVAGPALISLDILSHGHPTALGLVASALSIVPLIPSVLGFLHRPSHPYRDEPSTVLHPLGEVLSHYTSGAPRLIKLSKPQLIDGMKISDQLPVEFHENGRFASGKLAKTFNLSDWQFAKDTEIKQDETGQTRTIRLPHPVEIADILIPEGGLISFDPQGLILRVDSPEFNLPLAQEKLRMCKQILAEAGQRPFDVPFDQVAKAAFALAEWSDRSSIPHLCMLLVWVKDPRIRAEAAKYLGKLKATEAIPELLAIVKKEKVDGELRAEALRALEIIVMDRNSPPRELFFQSLFHRAGVGAAGLDFLDLLYNGVNPLHQGHYTTGALSIFALGALSLFSFLGAAAWGRSFRKRGEKVEKALQEKSNEKVKVRVEEFSESNLTTETQVEPPSAREESDTAEAEREKQAEDEVPSRKTQKL